MVRWKRGLNPHGKCLAKFCQSRRDCNNVSMCNLQELDVRAGHFKNESQYFDLQLESSFSHGQYHLPHSILIKAAITGMIQVLWLNRCFCHSLNRFRLR